MTQTSWLFIQNTKASQNFLIHDIPSHIDWFLFNSLTPHYRLSATIKNSFCFFRIAVLSSFEVNRLLFSNIFLLFDISVTQLYSPHHATSTSRYMAKYTHKTFLFWSIFIQFHRCIKAERRLFPSFWWGGVRRIFMEQIRDSIRQQ